MKKKARGCMYKGRGRGGQAEDAGARTLTACDVAPLPLLSSSHCSAYCSSGSGDWLGPPPPGGFFSAPFISLTRTSAADRSLSASVEAKSGLASASEQRERHMYTNTGREEEKVRDGIVRCLSGQRKG